MKQTLILITLLFLSTSLFAGDRTVYIERFTSSTCGPCAAQNPAVDAWFATQSPLEVLGVTYHMSWPAPGNDPMYHHNPTDNTARRNFYGVNAIPQGRFDGNTTLTYNQSWLSSMLTARRNILSPVAITLSTEASGNTVNVKVVVYCEQMLESPVATVYINVIEKYITNISPPSTNGETEFHDVMRKMLPTASGTTVSLTPGTIVVIEESFDMHPAWDPDEITVHAFVQNNASKEIYNSAIILTSFAFMPNPGFVVVDQGQSGNGSFDISIPTVAAGYNSPVTLSAEVEPSNAGINVSFPGGNQISSFPGSVQMNVTSTASVPAGVYKIIVSGTNSNNLIRKIVVNYLVGKNFVTVGTNRGNLNFLVNGVNYAVPQLFAWDIGSSQSLEAVTPQTVANTRYVFLNWSNGVSTHQQNVTINAGESSYTANYKTQFRIIAGVNPAGIPATVINGNEFHDSSATVTVSIEPTQVMHNGKMYYFNRWFGGGTGSYNGSDPSFQVTLTNAINQIAIFDTIDVGIATIGSEIPESFALYQNYPNPFNPETRIKFDIAKAGDVNLVVYNILGEEVARLHSGVLSPGKYEYTYNASNLSSGVYFYKILTEEFVSIKRMVVLK